MPEFKQDHPLPGYSADELTLLSLATFRKLGWTLDYALEHRLLGATKKTWNRPHDHIIVEAQDEGLHVCSQLPESASWDLFKKNQKNVRRFMKAFEEVKATAPDLSSLKGDLSQLRESTATAVDQEIREQAEVESVMKISSGNRALTYAIMAINVVVFALMAFRGVSLFEPTNEDLYVWGGNFAPATLGGEAWRLLTCIFVHAGLIHLALNLYALYIVGVFLEPMLGKLRYGVAYLCSGLIASLASIWWNGDRVISVGASGAVFGLYGVFLTLLFSKLIPRKMRSSLLQSIGIFVFYNLAYGAAKTGIDNAAHLGGLLSGGLIGLAYYFSLRADSRIKPVSVSISVALATALVIWIYFRDAG